MRYYVKSNELYHHGIHGQKWGVRHGPPYPLDDTTSRDIRRQNSDKKHLTKKQKELIVKGALVTAAVLTVVGLKYLEHKSNILNPLAMTIYEFGEKVPLDKLSSVSETISKKTTLQRISSTPVEDYVNKGKRLYASFTKRDNAIYKSVMPTFIKEWNKNGVLEVSSDKAYVHKLKLRRDIKVASELDVAKAYMKVNKVNVIDKGRYIQFMEGLVKRDKPLNDEFASILKSEGYDGMYDYHDIDNGLAKKPLILFDASELIESASSHELKAIEKFINLVTG